MNNDYMMVSLPASASHMPVIRSDAADASKAEAPYSSRPSPKHFAGVRATIVSLTLARGGG